MKLRVISSILIVFLGLTVSVYAGSLFSQHFTGIPASVQVLTANCTTLWSSPPGVAPGSNGALYFGCPAVGCTTACLVSNVAFTVAADGAAVPTFALPQPYTAAALVPPPSPNPPTAGCTMPTTGTTTLTSGTAFSFTGANGKGNSFYYCVAYTNAPSTGLPAFDVAWAQ